MRRWGSAYLEEGTCILQVHTQCWHEGCHGFHQLVGSVSHHGSSTPTTLDTDHHHSGDHVTLT